MADNKKDSALLLTVSGVAALLGYGRWTIREMLLSGELGFIPRGRIHKRIPRAEVDRWIKEKTVHGGVALRQALDKRRKS